MKKILILGGLCLAFAATASAQNSNGYWKRLQQTHPETTLDALQKAAPAVSQAPFGQQELEACRLPLVYEGETRTITSEMVELMKENGFKPSSIRQFKQEVLFSSAEKQVWLPVKSSLVGQLEIELAKDEPVLLYTKVLQDNDPQAQPIVLLVEDFQVK